MANLIFWGGFAYIPLLAQIRYSSLKVVMLYSYCERHLRQSDIEEEMDEGGLSLPQQWFAIRELPSMQLGVRGVANSILRN